MHKRITLHNRISVKILAVLLLLFSIAAFVVGYTNQNNIRRLYVENFTERVLLTNALMATIIDSKDVNDFVELMKNQDDQFKQRQVQYYHNRLKYWELQEAGASEETLKELSDSLKAFHNEMNALKTDKYWQTVDVLKHLKEVSNSTYLYVMADTGNVNEDGETLYTFILDADDDASLSDMEPDIDGLGTSDISQDTIEIVYETKEQMDHVVYYNEVYGELYYAYAPILNENGDVVAVFGTDLNLDKMNASITSSVALFNIIFSVIFILILIVLFLYLNRSIVVPLGSLTNTAHELAKGNIYTPTSESALKQRSEIGMLAHAVNDMSAVYQDMIRNAGQLFAAANVGKLNVRSDESKFKGDIANFIQQINDTLDAITLYFNGIPESIFIMNKDFEINFRNDSFCKLFGEMQAVEIISLLFSPQNDMDAQSKKEFVKEQVAHVLKQENNSASAWINGSCYSIILKEIDLDDRAENSILVIAIDITDLMREKENAQAAAEAKSSFLSRMSHEIRTPMNAVKGLSELLAMTELNSLQRNYIKNIITSSNSLLGIINDILDFSKIDANKIELIEEPYDLAGLITGICSVVSMRADEKNLSLLIDAPPHLPASLVGDDMRIKQVVTNLLSNSVKYTNEGYVLFKIRTEKRGGATWLICSVEDSGIGIREEDIPLLFQAFSQVDLITNRTIAGTGLGLAISKQLALAMGGDIEIESEYGKGSKFTMRIPQKVADAKPIAKVVNPKSKRVLLLGADHMKALSGMLDALDVPYTHISKQESLDVTGLSGFTHCLSDGSFSERTLRLLYARTENCLFAEIQNIHNSMSASDYQDAVIYLPVFIGEVAHFLNRDERTVSKQPTYEVFGQDIKLRDVSVLVVDDNDINLIVSGEILRSFDAEVICAESGEEAISLCGTRKFDIIFMDHMMPGKDGVETTIEIRTTENLNRETPIVALTANVINGMENLYLSSGMDDCISKPIEFSDLSRVLCQWLPKEKICLPDDDQDDNTEG